MNLLTKAELKRIMGGYEAAPDCSTGPCKYLTAPDTYRDGTCMIHVEPDNGSTKAVFTCYCSASGNIPVNHNGISHCDKSNPE